MACRSSKSARSTTPIRSLQSRLSTPTLAFTRAPGCCAVIEAFRLGILNAHIGVLPAYRGMNVAEWAALEGGSVGCSVHFIDTGIDTGPILATRGVDKSTLSRPPAQGTKRQ